MGFSRQEYWSGLPCPPPGDLPDPGMKPESLGSLALPVSFFTPNTTWKAPPPPKMLVMNSNQSLKQTEGYYSPTPPDLQEREGQGNLFGTLCFGSELGILYARDPEGCYSEYEFSPCLMGWIPGACQLGPWRRAALGKLLWCRIASCVVGVSRPCLPVLLLNFTKTSSICDNENCPHSRFLQARQSCPQ